MSETGGGFLAELRPRERRAIRIGLIVLVPALLLTGVVRPYFDALEESRDRLAAERALLVREKALVDEAVGFASTRLAAGEALEARSPRLFTGDPTLAAGALVRYVAEQADRSRVLLEATETAGAGEPGPNVVGVRVRVRAVSDIAGVLELLRRLEDGPRLVRVEQLSLERREGYRGGGTATDGQDVQLVTLAATVVGYTLTSAEGSGP